jgi:hypothetical protein
MSKKYALGLPIATFLICVIFYLFYDNKSYDYGLGCTFCLKEMPYGMKPHIASGFSFTLRDDDNFELVGIGFGYETTNFRIKDFLSYGYNDTSILAEVTDNMGDIRYLVSYETGYLSTNGKPKISFQELSDSGFRQVKNEYKWIRVDKLGSESVQRNKFISFLCAIVALGLIVVIINREN